PEQVANYVFFRHLKYDCFYILDHEYHIHPYVYRHI
ncbi:hypothetical protein ECPA31_3671, partial [Escherichia coli PA31]